MPASGSQVVIRRLAPQDAALLRSLNAVFGSAFGEQHTYCAQPPGDAYLKRLLARKGIVVIVA